MHGQYDVSDRSIILFNNGSHITLEDIEEDKELQTTALHECVHAIFNRTKLECFLYGIKYGTGTDELIENKKENSTYELGRGINEGLTNWVCGKAGFPDNSYKELLGLIKILELAIGEENVMKLCKGNIKGNIKRQLKMDTLECETFLSKFDNIYNITYKSMCGIRDITKVLNQYKNKDELDDKEKELLEKKYSGIVNGTSTYWKNIPWLKEDCSERDLWKEDIESQLYYFMEAEMIAKESKRDSLEEINSTIFEKYLKKEFEELVNYDYNNVKEVPMEMLKKFDNLYSLMNNLQFFGVEEFRNAYEEFDKKYFKEICSIVEQKYNNGTLSAKEFKQLADLANRDRDCLNTDFIHNVAETFYPQNSYMAERFLSEMYINDQIDSIDKYSIAKINVGDTDEITYIKDGKIVDIQDNGIFYSENLDKHDLFDFTIEETENEEKIIEDFMKLKEKVMQRNENATIQILNRLIIVNDKDDQECYLITDGELIPAKIEPIEEISFNFCEHQEEQNKLQVIEKKGIFKKLADMLKKPFQKSDIDKNELYYSEPEDLRSYVFRNMIKDMSLYDTTTQSKISEKEDNVDKSREEETRT